MPPQRKALDALVVQALLPVPEKEGGRKDVYTYISNDDMLLSCRPFSLYHNVQCELITVLGISVNSEE